MLDILTASAATISKRLHRAHVLVHDKDAAVIRLAVGWKHEESRFLRAVAFGRAGKCFAVGKCDFELAAASALERGIALTAFRVS